MADDLTLADDVRADLATLRFLMDAVPKFLRNGILTRGASEGIADENFVRLLANRDPSRPFNAIRSGVSGAPFALPDCTQDGAASPLLIRVSSEGALHLQCGHTTPHCWDLEGKPQAC